MKPGEAVPQRYRHKRRDRTAAKVGLFQLTRLADTGCVAKGRFPWPKLMYTIHREKCDRGLTYFGGMCYSDR